MAEELIAGVCSNSSWWCTAMSGSFDGAFSCSVQHANVNGSFNWATAIDMFDVEPRCGNEWPPSISSSSMDIQDIHFSQVSAPMVADSMLDSIPQAMEFGLSSTNNSWNQPLFETTGRAESCLHALVQGDMGPGLQVQQYSPTESNQLHARIENSSLIDPLKSMKQGFSVDNNGFIRNINGTQLYQEIFAVPTVLLQGLSELDSQLQQPIHSNQQNNCKSSLNYQEDSNESSRSSSDESLQLMQSSPPKQQPQFSNTTTSPIPSAAMTTEAPWSFNNPVPTHLVQHAFDESFSCSNDKMKSNSRAGDTSSTLEKRSDSEPALKKPRIETPSPLPTFKVRKEKLGDRITALQQLVSPFGKTDTASVLHEAIDYIKFLHDQVRVLSAQYLKNGHQIQEVKENLKNRGLCLVPVSATFAVAKESPVDFWTPFIGGTYRL